MDTQAVEVMPRIGCGGGGGVVDSGLVGDVVGDVGFVVPVGVVSVDVAVGVVDVGAGREPGLTLEVVLEIEIVPVGLEASVGVYWMVWVYVVVFPAGSVADTVTAFLPDWRAIVLDHVPSAATSVFTPFTVTTDPGSAVPEMVVFDPVTTA